MNRNFLFFISAVLVLVISLSGLTSCASSNVSPSEPIGMRFPDVHDVLIIKYGSKGDQVWQNVEDLGEKDAYVPLNLDKSGNSYIIGSNYNVKYDSNGKQAYSNTFKDNNITAYSSVLDEQGNIYLTGYSNAGEIYLFRYDNNGNQIWAKHYKYPGNFDTRPSGITLDEAGNVYITGSTFINAEVPDNNKLLIIKFDNNGNLLWSVKDGGLLQGNTTIGPVVDTSGNVYVTGFTQNATSYNYVTVKYDTRGTKQWETYYDGPASGYDVPHDLKVDSNGNVIVTGESDGLGNIREIATIKYDSGGTELWVSRYVGTNGCGGTPSALTIDSQGNIYITGRSFNGASGGDDYVTIKYDSSGQQLWDARYGGMGTGGLNEASALFVDDTGNVYITGQCSLDSQYVTYDTVKYGPDGNKLWVARYSKTSFVDRPDKLMVSALGNVYLIGRVSHYSN